MIRINELARELEVKSKAIIDYLPGIDVTDKKSHSSALEDDLADKVREHFRALGEPEPAEAAAVPLPVAPAPAAGPAPRSGALPAVAATPTTSSMAPPPTAAKKTFEVRTEGRP